MAAGLLIADKAFDADKRARDHFIPAPTREQFMAGSANLRRVYKVEA